MRIVEAQCLRSLRACLSQIDIQAASPSGISIFHLKRAQVFKVKPEEVSYKR